MCLHFSFFCSLSVSDASAVFLVFYSKCYLYNCTLGCRLSSRTLWAAGGLSVTPCCAAKIPQTEEIFLKSPHSQPADQPACKATERPLKLSLSFVICPPLFLLSSFTLLLDSFLCLPLFIFLSPSLSFFFYILSRSVLPAGFFLFMRALGLLCYLL